MREKTIYTISLIMILVGLSFLFIYADELDLKAIETVETVTSGEPIQLSGTITKMNVQDGTLFLEVEGSKVVKTPVIVFSEEDIFLQEGDFVEVSGMIEEYNGETEIVASKVVKK
jgi:DNA/RNA endonuclease YhcR with UshA esterase domain